MTDLKEPLAMLENQTKTDYHFVQLELVGTVSERDAIGTAVVITLGDRRLTKVVQAGDGYMAKNQSMLSYGIGTHTLVEKLEITWASGHQQTHTALPSGRWLIVEGQIPYKR